MKEKICIICKVDKPLSEYYKHKEMGDGHLNKCKECCKSQAKERQKNLYENDEEWRKKERERGRDKYHRLNYIEKHSDAIQKYPWKNNNKYKGLRKWFQSNNFPLDKDIELHHWSYKEENLRDVILMSRSAHKRLHNHLEVNVDLRCYIVKDTGDVLDTKEKHVNFMKKVGFA